MLSFQVKVKSFTNKPFVDKKKNAQIGSLLVNLKSSTLFATKYTLDFFIPCYFSSLYVLPPENFTQLCLHVPHDQLTEMSDRSCPVLGRKAPDTFPNSPLRRPTHGFSSVAMAAVNMWLTDLIQHSENPLEVYPLTLSELNDREKH